MLTSKESLRETVDLVLRRLPEQAKIRDLIDELEAKAAVEEGLRDVEENRLLTLEEFKKQTESCLSKS
jgi:hypothetical protein